MNRNIQFIDWHAEELTANKKSRRGFLRYLGAGVGTAALAGGCASLTISDRIEDMSDTPYAPLILKKADTLADSKDPESWRKACELYGSIGRVEGALNKMDVCARKYFEQDAIMGLIVLKHCQYIRELYKGKKIIRLESILSSTQRI